MMKKENILVVALVILGFCAVLIYNQVNHKEYDVAPANASIESRGKGGIQWRSYHEGLEISETDNKPVFLYFHADWCQYCYQLEKTTFLDPKVAAYLNENYISIKVDVDREKDIARKYRATVLPTMFFISFVHKTSDIHRGYLKAEQLLEYLRKINPPTENTGGG